MFKTRLLSGIILVVLALILIITGGNVLLGTLALLCEDDNILQKSPPSHIETAGWGASNLLEIPREV